MNLHPRLLATSLVTAVGLAACSGPEDLLDPAGPGAARIAGLWWYLFVLGTSVFVLVMALFAVPLLRQRRLGDGDVPPEVRADERRPRRWIALGGIAMPLVVLAAIQVVALPLGEEVAPGREVEDAIDIEVESRQFWWHVRYADADVVTANEIHIPTGTPVRFRVTTADVIHVFWIPRLHGKVEATPGRVLELVLEADEPGLYPGRCAEFCGLAHAQMKLQVIAHAPDEFAAWLEGQTAGAALPETETAARGLEVFRSSSCVYCHQVRGHTPPADVGPDLTHLASRRTLAAGLIPNDRGHLGGWIVDPQSIKPGNRMPGTQLDGRDLRALLDYLESLR